MPSIQVDIEDFHIPINRLEIIDHTNSGTGRITILNGKSCIVGFSMQDDNKTLKIFVSDGSK